jgi:N-acetylmuramoyl-L-alanine amidase
MDLKAIFIEAGHWFPDNWAVGNGIIEREENIKIARKTIDYINQSVEFKNIHIVDIGVWVEINLIDKISSINALCKKQWYTHENSILISIHCNAWGWWKATGIEGWFYNSSKQSMDLIKNICNQICSLTTLPYRFVKSEIYNRYGRLWIIHDTIPLGCLIECWFVDNPKDAVIIATHPELFWQWIVRWIKQFLKIPLKTL